MSLKRRFCINTAILIFLISSICSCNTDVNTMIVDYASMYGIGEDYDDSPEPGDVDFNPESMLLDDYCNEINTFLEIPGPTKCGSYRWRFDTIIDNEVVEIPDIICASGYSLDSNVLLIDKPVDSGFEVGKTYYLTLTVTDRRGGNVRYSDRAIIIFYEDRLKNSH